MSIFVYIHMGVTWYMQLRFDKCSAVADGAACVARFVTLTDR